VNAVGLPDTFFTASPRWEWLIVWYFFLGGIAGGAYFLAALLDFLGAPEDRRLARLGYLVALPAVVVCGILLILDLSRPLRFWHTILESQTWLPMVKWWSPMSIGSWVLLGFGLFTGVSFLAALGERGRAWRRWAGPFRPPHPLGTVWTIVGALLGLFVAGYTGVLLAVTNRPVWADTSLLGLVFLLSGASTAAALLILLARVRRWRSPGMTSLAHFDSWVLGAELVALIALVFTVGWTVSRHVWLNWWGALFVLGVLVAGILIPLVLEVRARAATGPGVVAAAVLVLLGGFLLRVVILLSPETLRVALTLPAGGLT
jgi:protein NrfD